MEKETYLTALEFMNLPSMKGSKVIVGSDLDQKVIHSANMMEVPDICDWVVQHELLMTTGYPFRNDLDSISILVERLHQNNVAGLAIKPKRFIDVIPDDVIAKARELGFLLIEVAPNVIFANVIGEAMEALLRKREEKFLMEQLLFQKISDNIQSKADIFSVIDFISMQIKCRLLYIDFSDDIQYYAGGDLKTTSIETSVRDLLTDVNEDGFYFVPYLEKSENAYICCLGNQVAGKYVVILGDQNRLSDMNLSMLKNIFTLLNIRITNEQEVEKIKFKYRDRFIYDWLNGNFNGENEIITFAKSYGINVSAQNKYYTCIVSGEKILLKKIRRYLERLENYFYDNAIGCYFDNVLIVVLKENTVNHLELVEQIRKIFSMSQFSLCIGGCKSVQKLRESLEEALKICNIAKRCSITDTIITADQLGSYSVLSLLPKNDEVDKFIKRYVQPIISYDNSHGTEFLLTLKVYFDNGCNAKLTSQKMFIHYNTVSYRLEKIKKILCIDINDPKKNFELELAIKLEFINQLKN